MEFQTQRRTGNRGRDLLALTGIVLAFGTALAAPASASTFAPQATLTASDEIGYSPARRGESVALSADGKTALVGGSKDNSGAGAVWVFTRSGSTWTQQAELTGSGEVTRRYRGGKFGSSVALSADGNTALIGGPGDNEGVGAAWVFTRTGSTWTQQGSKLTGRGEITRRWEGEGRFGTSVALSADGNTALIGGPGDARVIEQEGEVTEKSKIVRGLTSTAGIVDGTEVSGARIPFPTWVTRVASSGQEVELNKEAEGEGSATVKEKLTFTRGGVGAAWVFTRSGSTWSQQGEKLTGSGESAAFGTSVALSADGNTALIGVPGDLCEGCGSVRVFARSGSTWTQQGPKLVPSPPGGGGNCGPTTLDCEVGEVGQSVALSADGNTALIGARWFCEGPSRCGYFGAAWVFTRSGGVWTQQGPKLSPSDKEGEELGTRSLALSADGNTALIGARNAKLGIGAVWMFTRTGTTWTQQGATLTGSGETSAGEFGASVALSEGGDRALIGSPADDHEIGGAWVFSRSGSSWGQEGDEIRGQLEPVSGDLASAVALSGDGDIALIGGTHDDGYKGAVWVFVRSGSMWTQEAKLTGGGESGSGEFGAAVALSSDGKTAVIGSPADNGGIGAVWVFRRSGSHWKQLGAKLLGRGEKVGSGEETVCSEYERCYRAQGRFGESVALSSDGEVALIGGPGDNENDGAAWIFTRSRSTWTQQGEKLTGSGEQNFEEASFCQCHTRIGGQFGTSVALSSDGDTAVIGGPRDAPAVEENEFPGPPNGAAWVFVRSGSTWKQQGGKVGGEFGSRFGESVAVPGNGTRAVVGAPKEGPPWYDPNGVAWVLTRSGSTWTRQEEALGRGQNGYLGEQLGVRLALSAIGNVALIAHKKASDWASGSPPPPPAGAWVFIHSGATWTRQSPPLTCGGEACSQEPIPNPTVALSGDASTALVGTAVYVSHK